MSQAIRCLTGLGRRITSTHLSGKNAIPAVQSRFCSGTSEDVRKEPGEMDNLMDIGSRKIFTSEHDLFREQARRYWRENVVPELARYENDGHIGRAEILRAGKSGMLGVGTPAEDGGLGGGYLHGCIVVEEQMYVNDTSSGFSMHSEVVMPYLSDYGTKEQKEKYLPRMTAGEVYGAVAMTEPGAGSDLQGLKTTCVKDGDDWILNGSKIYITNGFLCDMAIVVAKTNPEARSPAQGLSLFLVDANSPGFVKGQPLNKLGMKGQDTCELFFEDVRVPASSLLGKENQAFYYLMNQLPVERLLVAVLCVASMEWAFEETRSYVKERKAFGRRIADLQVIQHKLAEMKSSICVSRAFIDQCMQIHNERGLDASTASMAKYWTSELLNKVTFDCTQMFGGGGFMFDNQIVKCYALARCQTIYAGTNEIMKELIARQIVKD